MCTLEHKLHKVAKFQQEFFLQCMRVHKKDLFQFVGEKTLIFHSMDRSASNKLCLSKMYTHTRGNEGGFYPPTSSRANLSGQITIIRKST
jgi:hypothetical protein